MDRPIAICCSTIIVMHAIAGLAVGLVLSASSY
jgi:hypothetical protein